METTGCVSMETTGCVSVETTGCVSVETTGCVSVETTGCVSVETTGCVSVEKQHTRCDKNVTGPALDCIRLEVIVVLTVSQRVVICCFEL